MMHDIVSDILTSSRIARAHKRTAIYVALAEFRDTTRNVMSQEDWLTMGHHMGGIDAMGGPAVGLLPGGRRPDHEMPMNPHE